MRGEKCGKNMVAVNFTSAFRVYFILRAEFNRANESVSEGKNE